MSSLSFTKIRSGRTRWERVSNAIRDQSLADRSLTFEDIAKSEGVVL
jgi:hypothetical protein